MGEEFGERDPKAIYKIIVVLAVIFIFISSYLIATEIFGAKKGCESLNGIYSLKIYPPKHLCDNRNFSEYSIGGWNFDSNMDLRYGG